MDYHAHMNFFTLSPSREQFDLTKRHRKRKMIDTLMSWTSCRDNKVNFSIKLNTPRACCHIDDEFFGEKRKETLPRAERELSSAIESIEFVFSEKTQEHRRREFLLLEKDFLHVFKINNDECWREEERKVFQLQSQDLARSHPHNLDISLIFMFFHVLLYEY